VDFPIAGYTIKSGALIDRTLLNKFMAMTYAELFPGNSVTHLSTTVEQYFSVDTPLWWVFDDTQRAIACLWLGVAIDQSSGIRHAHIFLLYVRSPHRRQGIAKALIQLAETWATQRGDRQIGLQVFANNPPAVALYQSLGYEIAAYAMLKRL
jgi:ribosomal protein S18 acetylase RimI-like enzyme